MLVKNVIKKMIIPVMLIAALLTLSACGQNTQETTTAVSESDTETKSSEENKGGLLLGSSSKASATSIGIESAVDENLLTDSYDASEDPKFGAAVISITPDDFAELGFTLGDSCDITFSNGYTLTDVPYFNGYYVKTGAPVLVAYPGNDYLLVTLNNRGIWDTAGLSDDVTVDISLNTSAKYLATQEALGQIYSFKRTDYTTDSEFCNFRALSGGNLKENFLFRGASPVDNSRGRASYTDSLLKANSIACVIDLADSVDNMESYINSSDFNSPYTKSLYDEGKIVLLSMGSSYESDTYKKNVVKGLQFLIQTGGPAYIHCMEGKDRTGFVCMLIEALAGATYDEMLSDYMTTYENYYKIFKDKTPEKYEAVADLYFNSFMEYLHGTDDVEELKTADFTYDAEDYLEEGGMSEEEINELITLITE